jgi:GNAT superfamily N-acetyltransferase
MPVGLIHRFDVALLSTEPMRATVPDETRQLQIEALAEPARIVQAHATIGHQVSEKMLERRLRNGLSFAVFHSAGTPIATSWLASGGRYVDEFNWWFPIAADELWIRDVFVHPQWRGRRVFSAIVLALGRRSGCPDRRIWSDVDWDNRPSMQAHKTAGFNVVARLRALDFGGIARWRCALPDWPLPVLEINPGSRWIWLSGQHLKRHRDLLA